MNLQQLETFRWVAILGSFTKAAQNLNTTQSTVSVRISELEQELGVQLLDRTQRVIQTTAKGRELLRYVTDIHFLITDLRANVSNPESISGSIRVGIAELIALTWLPDWVVEIKRQYPKIELELEIGLSSTMYDKIRAGEIDLCFQLADHSLGQGLETLSLGDVKFAYMASSRLCIPDRKLNAQDLENWPVILLGPDSVLSEMQERWFRENEASLSNSSRTNSMEISAGLVRSGLGVALLPVDFYAPDIKAGKMKMLDLHPQFPPVSFYAIYATNNYSPLVQKVMQLAKKVAKANNIGA